MVDVTCQDRETLTPTDAHDAVLDCLVAGIEAAQPARRVEETCTVRDDVLTVTETTTETDETHGYDLGRYDDIVLVGGGNAAGHFATAIETELGELLTTGAVVTDDPVETATVDVLEGDHPIPSQTGVRHTERVLELVEAADENDLVVVLVTGGASALLSAPAESISLSALQTVTTDLLACGATIDEFNAVRKHCSAIKGGQLARAATPATVVTLALSDVVGDDPSVIGSGPTVPDPSTYADALDVLERYDVDLPAGVRTHLQRGRAGDQPETPTASDPVFDRTDTHIIGTGRTALEAARDTAADHGYEPLILSSRVRGEARESALTHAAIAEECREHGTPVSPPAILLSGGETTVTLADDHGRGGPNQEFVLGSTLALETADIVVGSVDTDGIDGATDAAGALADATAIDTADGQDALARNDSLPILDDAEALVRTGPTGTNVNDLRVIAVEPSD